MFEKRLIETNFLMSEGFASERILHGPGGSMLIIRAVPPNHVEYEERIGDPAGRQKCSMNPCLDWIQSAVEKIRKEAGDVR